MENAQATEKAQNLQKTYQNTLKFVNGQSVYIYVGGTRHSFKHVVSLVIDVMNSLVTILTPNSIALFCNWDGIEVGEGQPSGFMVSSEE